jgi:hypothetical protein
MAAISDSKDRGSTCHLSLLDIMTEPGFEENCIAMIEGGFTGSKPADIKALSRSGLDQTIFRQARFCFRKEK